MKTTNSCKILPNTRNHFSIVGAYTRTEKNHILHKTLVDKKLMWFSILSKRSVVFQLKKHSD